MEAVLESLGLVGTTEKKTEDEDDILKDFQDGSQLMVVNCYPACPEPNLTLGMPPHSDYGCLTLLLQDEVEGLQIQFQDKWVTVEPIANSFVVNVGDHLEVGLIIKLIKLKFLQWTTFSPKYRWKKFLSRNAHKNHMHFEHVNFLN